MFVVSNHTICVSNHTICVSLNNQQCMTQPTLI